MRERGGLARAGAALSARPRRIALALLAALAVGSCSGQRAASTRAAASLPLDAQQAQASADFGGSTLTLGGALWRDFMPPQGARGSPLHASIEVVATGEGPMPADAVVSGAAIAVGGRVWTMAPTRGMPGDGMIVYVASGGPRWGPGVQADLYAYVVANARAHWLHRPGVAITRTE